MIAQHNKKEILFRGAVFAILMSDIGQKALEATGLTVLFLFRVYHVSL